MKLSQVIRQIRLFTLWIALFSFLLSACNVLLVGDQDESGGSLRSWNPADVRLIDDLDSTTAGSDLIAVYIRRQQGKFQVRLDFLELNYLPEFDIYLAFDHQPGGQALPWQDAGNSSDYDKLVSIHADGAIQVQEPIKAGDGWQQQPGSRVTVLRNPVFDAIEIVMDDNILDPFSADTRMLVAVASPFTAKPGSGKLDPVEPTTPLLESAEPEPSGSAPRAEHGEVEIADEAGPFYWKQSMPERVPVLLAFSNTFPAYTPSQSLRRWDGAHTGPSGGRHGLGNLLRIARNHNVHLLLLDLLSPESLAALDYQGGVPLVRQMQEHNLVTLPVPLPYYQTGMPGWMVDRFLKDARDIAARMSLTGSSGIPAGEIRFYPQDVDTLELITQLGYPGYAAVQPGSQSDPDILPERGPAIIQSRITAKDQTLEIHLPATASSQEPDQATPEGLSLPWKILLSQTAFLKNSKTANQANHIPANSILVMGGSLPQSSWGHPASARAAIRYILAHPWLRISDALDLRPGTNLIYPLWEPTWKLDSPLQEKSDDFLTRLEAGLWDSKNLDHPGRNLGQAAWDMFRSLFAPIFPISADLPALREHYLDEVDLLNGLAQVVKNTGKIPDCSTLGATSPGNSNCTLSNEQTIAVISAKNGALTHLIGLCQDTEETFRAHQLIGPTAQLVTGLSDPLDWDLNAPSDPDPAVIPGAFWDADGVGSTKILISDETGFRFVSEDGETEKHYQLLPDGIEVNIVDIPMRKSFAIPLVLDPWERFSPGGISSYHGSLTSTRNGFSWQQGEAIRVTVESSTPLQAVTFKDSLGDLHKPENPNFEYPAGHYLPFPLALVNPVPSKEFTVSIRFQCSP